MTAGIRARTLPLPTGGPRAPHRVALLSILAVLAVATAIGGFAAGEPLAAVGGVSAVVLALGAAVRPQLLTPLVILVIYSNAAVVAVTFHGLPLVIGAAIPLLLVIPLLHAILVRREPIIIAPALPWILGLLIVQLVSALAAADVAAATQSVAAFVIEGLALYILVTNVVRTERIVRQTIWVLLLVGALLGGLSLWQQVTGTHRDTYFGFAQTNVTGSPTSLDTDRTPRLAGPVGEKNRYAQVMLMLVPLGLVMAASARQRLLRLAAASSAVLASVAVVLTFSRGAALAFAIVLVLMAMLRFVRPIHIAALVAGGALMLVAAPQYVDRITSIEGALALFDDEEGVSEADGSVLSRATTNLAGIAMFNDHPMLGVGPGQFPAHYRQYAGETPLRVKAEDRQAHNMYLQFAAELGVPGLAMLGAILLATLRALWRARRRWVDRRPDLASLATAFVVAIVAYMATAVFLHLSYARYFWLMLALAGATAHVLLTLREERTDGEPPAVPKAWVG